MRVFFDNINKKDLIPPPGLITDGTNKVVDPHIQ